MLSHLSAARTLVIGAIVSAALLACEGAPPPDKSKSALPAPSIDVSAGTATSATAVFAGGCFWGIQGVFQHVKGVTGAVSGYAGGAKDTAIYEVVSTGTTGHAESVKVTYDPGQITYGQLLQIFFTVHDPTELNLQGPDFGPQYRSAIFPRDDEQASVAKAYITQLNNAHVFDKAIVTTIEPGRTFFPAESYHQDYLTRNPTSMYIVINDLPKIEELKQVFPDRYRADPVLVNGTAS
jgi:peptide-methionine (S)-S-oxide reductase